MQYTISIEEPCSDIKYHKGELEMTLKELITVYGGDEAIQEDFSMLSDDEKNIILNEFNMTNMKIPSNLTIIDLFEKQVKLTPNNIAPPVDL